jgi:hypothetical protein
MKTNLRNFNPINAFQAWSPAKIGGGEDKQLGSGSQIGLLSISVLLAIVVLGLVAMLMRQMPFPG